MFEDQDLQFRVTLFQNLAIQLSKDSGWNEYRVVRTNLKLPKKFRIELFRINRESPGFKVHIDDLNVRAEWIDLDRPNRSVAVHVLEVDLRHPKSIDKLTRFCKIAKKKHSRVLDSEEIKLNPEHPSQYYVDNDVWETEYVYHNRAEVSI